MASARPADVRQLWAQIAQGMQQDLQGYESLRGLLRQQFHAALRHDAQAMQDVASQIAACAQTLQASSRVRVALAQQLLPAGVSVSMRTLFAQLKGPLQQQLLRLWERLEQLVQQCQADNVRNCGLIMEQAQLMRQVLTGQSESESAGVYGPG